MTFIKEIFLGREKLFTLNAIIFHGALLAMSSTFVYVFSYSTSFGYDLLGGDSSIFQVIGKYWTQGYLPYVDLFDHKGPLLFFINAIGYMIYPRSGIMALQIISLYLSCLFIWRAMELYSSSVWKVFFLLLTLIYYAAHYEEGNHVEEYTVLFLSAAAYCFLLSLKEDKFPPLYGFIYGLGFGACFLIRLSDAAQICCQCFLVAVFLLQARDFKTLWQNVLSFLAGFAAIVLPFVIYFAAHDALYDMIYGTLLFNLKYTLVETTDLPIMLRINYQAFHGFPFLIMILLAMLSLKKNPSNKLMQSALFIGAMLLCMFMKLRYFPHYFMLFLPVAPILFAVLHKSYDALHKVLHGKKYPLLRVLIKVFIVLAVFQVTITISYLKLLLLNEENDLFMFFPLEAKRMELLDLDNKERILELRKLIPQHEQKSFVIWGEVSPPSHWILRTDIKSCERFFVNNSFHATTDKNIRREWFDNVRADYPLWILYGTDPNRNPDAPPSTPEEDAELEKLLAARYSLKGEVFIYPQLMKLYRLKE